MNNKIFISGKITGDNDYRQKFCHRESRILSTAFSLSHTPERYVNKHGTLMTFATVNPCDLTLFGRDLENFPWWVAMAVCLWHLIGCSHVYMLGDWQDSRGARLEHRVAKLTRKHIIYEKKI